MTALEMKEPEVVLGWMGEEQVVVAGRLRQLEFGVVLLFAIVHFRILQKLGGAWKILEV